MSQKWIISCEHGGKQIPAAYAPFFQDAGQVLNSHRGYDPGALDLFSILSRQLADFALFSETSRLLVELNRSLHHKSLFSAFTKELPKAAKKEILAQYYLPYRNEVEGKIQEYISAGNKVIHLSIHSFTPVLDGETRKADIGLLYDPGKAAEQEFCRQWKVNLKQLMPHIKVRLNYPYLGTADGFTTYLRKQFPEQYVGIELEVNQKHQNNKQMQEQIMASLLSMKRRQESGD